jgi:hypothetical protein
VHAFQTASFAYAFSSGQAAQWKATLSRLQRDVPPMLTAARDGGHAMQIVVTPRISNPGKAKEDQTEYYDADLVFVPAPGPSAAKEKAKGKGKAPPARKAVVLKGQAGTEDRDYQAMAEAAGKSLGLPPDLLRQGHFAIYGLINMMTALNASNDGLQRHAFALLVLQEKIKNGEKADWFGGNRPPEETLKDTQVALRVIAAHHASTAAFRSEILGIVAMVNGYKAPGAVDLLKAQADESLRRNDAWIAEHHQPTMEEFGVAMNEFKLPTPDVLLERLDESGYLSAAITIAKGVATGSVSTTLEGLTKLAPRDSSLKIILEGLTASSRGDVLGTADAVLRLAGKKDSPLAKRLAQLQEALGTIQGGASQVASALDRPPADLEGLKKAAQDLSEGTDKIQRGSSGVVNPTPLSSLARRSPVLPAAGVLPRRCPFPCFPPDSLAQRRHRPRPFLAGAQRAPVPALRGPADLRRLADPGPVAAAGSLPRGASRSLALLLPFGARSHRDRPGRGTGGSALRGGPPGLA